MAQNIRFIDEKTEAERRSYEHWLHCELVAESTWTAGPPHNQSNNVSTILSSGKSSVGEKV